MQEICIRNKWTKIKYHIKSIRDKKENIYNTFNLKDKIEINPNN